MKATTGTTHQGSDNDCNSDNSDNSNNINTNNAGTTDIPEVNSHQGRYPVYKRQKQPADFMFKCSETVLCVLISCLLIGVCSAACDISSVNGQVSSNCTNTTAASDMHDLANQTQIPSNTSVNQAESLGEEQHNSTTVTPSSEESSSSSSEELDIVHPKFRGVNPEKENGDESSRGKQAVNEEKAKIGNTAALSGSDNGDSDGGGSDGPNIVAIVIPFVSVIVFAIIFCVIFKLCRHYKCCKNDACLKKCSAICDNCMSQPMVFQGNVQAKAGSGSLQAANGTPRSSHLSLHSTVSHHQRTAPAPILRQPNSGQRSSQPGQRLSWNSQTSSHGSHHNLAQSAPARHDSSHHARHDSSHHARHDSSHHARHDSSHSTHHKPLLPHDASHNGHHNSGSHDLARHNSGHHNVARHDSGRLGAHHNSGRRFRHDSGASRHSHDSARELLNPHNHH